MGCNVMPNGLKYNGTEIRAGCGTEDRQHENGKEVFVMIKAAFIYVAPGQDPEKQNA